MKPLRILVVEDEGIVAFLLAQILESMGHEVCGIETDKAGAIAAAKRCKPDLMIVDDRLGRDSGLTVIETILLDGSMPHVFVSGDVSRIRSSRPLAVVLEKPFFEADLEQAIWRALSQPTAASHLEPIDPTGEGFAARTRIADRRRA
jgi:CheY-like chemotaxis protein